MAATKGRPATADSQFPVGQTLQRSMGTTENITCCLKEPGQVRVYSQYKSGYMVSTSQNRGVCECVHSVYN